MEIIRGPVPWLVSGVLSGIGFVTGVSGGLPLLFVGLGIGVTLFIRRRGRRRGWPALLYGAGIIIALSLLPFILQPPPCLNGRGAGCYQGFTVGTFVVALLLALTGLFFSIQEVRRGPRP